MVGYNISLEIGGKTLLGRTQDDLNISAIIKESLTKDNSGVTQRAVVDHDVTITVSALCMLNASGTTTQLDRDDVIALAMGTSAVAVQYKLVGGATYGGNFIITGYTESSNASGTEDATVGLTLQNTGAFAVVS